ETALSTLPPQPPSNPDKHSHARLSRYVDIHYAVIAQLTGNGFICFDTTKFKRTPSIVTLSGHIGCVGELVVGVEKTMLVVAHRRDGEPLVQTVSYAYNATSRVTTTSFAMTILMHIRRIKTIIINTNSIGERGSKPRAARNGSGRHDG